MAFLTDILDSQMKSLQWIEHNAGLSPPPRRKLTAAEYIERRLADLGVEIRS